MWGAVLSLLGRGAGAVGEYQSKKQDLKTLKLTNEFRIQEAKTLAEVARWQHAASTETNWDLQALQESRFSWKDEAWTVVFMIILLAHFVPFTQPYMDRGWIALQSAPEWVQIAFPLMIAASFGIRWGMKSLVNLKKS